MMVTPALEAPGDKGCGGVIWGQKVRRAGSEGREEGTVDEAAARAGALLGSEGLHDAERGFAREVL
jgi:hypothetical protein